MQHFDYKYICMPDCAVRMPVGAMLTIILMDMSPKLVASTTQKVQGPTFRPILFMHAQPIIMILSL